jgi:CRP-like cAMP-binding protein
MTLPIEQSIALTAFMVGVISAISLPLGALTSRFWVPQDRTVAGLMAFGGGALLAALSVDLVAPAMEHGHFYEIATGAILGGLIFVLLNELVNDYGGFIRKVSTSVYHLRRQHHQQYQKVLSRLDDLDIFGEIENRDFRAIAAFIEVRHYPRNSHIYQPGDPCDGLFILAEGAVSLLDPRQQMQELRRVNRWETFARQSFLTGAPHDKGAVAATRAEVWMLPREKFLTLLVSSPRLAQAIHGWLRNPATAHYLVERQHMSPEAADAWADDATRALVRHATVPPAREIERAGEHFQDIADRLARTPLLGNLPLGELDEIAEYLVHKRKHKGEAFFHDGDLADRLYLVDEGEVSLMTPRDHTRKRELMRSGQAFGRLAFISGSRHAVAAIATEDTSYWVLLRRDLPTLLPHTPVLRSRLEQATSDPELHRYLQSHHDLTPEKIERWARQARTDLAAGRVPAAVAEMFGEVHVQHGAALAIWLGILLDSIPESLVLGTIQAKSSISLSLIAGLFLSNYPEALSSSIGMKHQGLRFGRVLLMWSSLVLITGIGAAMGALFFGNVSAASFSIIEGIAAGAMLTMIAQTMLPEAYIKGGNVVGLATLTGFLVALFFKELG